MVQVVIIELVIRLIFIRVPIFVRKTREHKEVIKEVFGIAYLKQFILFGKSAYQLMCCVKEAS